MRRYAILGVEGPHDQAFIGKILKERWDFCQFGGSKANLDPFWDRFIPIYPKSGNLYKRLDMPAIFNKDDDLSLAIYVGEGTKLNTNLQDIMANNPSYCKDVCSFGLIIDSDNALPDEVTTKYASSLQSFFPTIPIQPGQIAHGPPRTGIFVLPDNQNPGVLESLLLVCGHVVYANPMNAAKKFLDQLAPTDKTHWRPFDDLKAHIATVVSVLKPGKTNTVSIADNDWISPNNFTCTANQRVTSVSERSFGSSVKHALFHSTRSYGLGQPIQTTRSKQTAHPAENIRNTVTQQNPLHPHPESVFQVVVASSTNQAACSFG